MFGCLSAISKREGDFRTTMANIFTLTVYVILHIFRFLRIEDKIAFSLSCQQFRRLCVDEGVFRKLDLSSCVMSTSQRCAVIIFFRDRQLTEDIKELNLSNLRVLNWGMDMHLQKFIKSICPQLEALNVLNCGVSLQTLHSILHEAPQLTSLSWSIWDFTSEDIQFLLKAVKSSEETCLKNIKHLRLHVNDSLPQIEIAKYLVLSCCRNLEELAIYSWSTAGSYCTGGSFPLASYESIPGFHLPSDENELNNLNSLVMELMGDDACFDKTYKKKLYDFVLSVLSRKSSSTKWKKLCILPKLDIYREQFSRLFRKVHSDDFHSVEAIGADLRWTHDAVEKMKTLFEGVADNTVRRLHLCLPRNSNSIVEFCNPISRVAGHSLKVLRLFFESYKILAEPNIVFHALFSNCSNITELDLLACYFKKDICEPLSQLKRLTKVQLKECVIGSKYNRETGVETSKANLLPFIENCKNITHLDVRGCNGHGIYSSFFCRVTDDDLLALAKLRNLESLTLSYIRGIRDWTFLKNILEHCIFLTTLRISDSWEQHFNSSHMPILMESFRFLKHLAIKVRNVPIFSSEVFWSLLRHAKNLERLCITNYKDESINIPAAVETLKSLPRLHVLHLHNKNIENGEDFFDQLIRMLEEKKSDCTFSFEIVMRNRWNTWINHPTAYGVICNILLPLNKAELCDMKPILDIPKF